VGAEVVSGGERDYGECEALLLCLDVLLTTGRGDSRQADELRDALDGPWRRLTPAQRAGLAAQAVQQELEQRRAWLEEACPS
jgi:hypothetical protein